MEIYIFAHQLTNMLNLVHGMLYQITNYKTLKQLQGALSNIL